MSMHAYEIGTTSKRIYGTARLSVSRHTMRRLSKAAAFYGLSLSATARRLLAIADQMDEGKSATALQLMNYFYYKAKRGTRPTKAKPRRKTHTIIDLWAQRQEEEYRHAKINLRLTARNLADIETRRQEAEQSQTLPRTFSKAFCALLILPLTAVSNMIRDYESGSMIANEPERRTTPRRVNRLWRMTEAKKRMIEQGKTSDL